MAFAGINYLGVITAAVVSFLFGGLWYGILAKQWMAAIGKTEDQIKASGSVAPMLIAVVALLIMAFVLAGIVGHLGPGNVTIKNGIISGLFVWTGFVATSLSVNYAFQMHPRQLLLIDTGHWLGVLVIQGAVIGLFGT